MTDAAGPDPSEELSVVLRRARREAGLTQLEVVKRVEVSQAQLSRIEKGRSLPTPTLTRALLVAYGMTELRVSAAVALAEALAVEHVDARVVLQGGAAHHFQLRIAAAEGRAKLVRSYHPVTVLGVLQTRAFAAAVFTPDQDLSREDADAAVAARMVRWSALSEPTREWRLIQTEQAIRWPVRSYALQAAQVEQLVVASRLPNVRLGIVALDTVAPGQVALTGFHVYDDRQVLVGTDLGSALLSTPERVAEYVARFETLEGLAVFGDEAREILVRIAADYRAGGTSGRGDRG